MPILSLFNFCDFTEFQITLPDSGIILLDGHSGAGKSTLFQAMAFVLHDMMKTGCYPRGDDSKSKPKTWVSINWTNQDLIIFRQRRPNLLIVQHQGVEYRDDPAQAWINSKYGSANRWQAASYRQQDERWSFLDLPSGEKLQVLQELAGDSWSPAYGRLYDYTIQLIHKAEGNYRENALQKSIEQKTYEHIRGQLPSDAQTWTVEQREQRKTKYSTEINTLDEYLGDIHQWYAKETQICRKVIEVCQAKITEHKSQLKYNDQLLNNIAQYKQLLGNVPTFEQDITVLEERLSNARAAKLIADQLERRSQILIFLSSVESQLSKIPICEKPSHTENELQNWKNLLGTVINPKEDLLSINHENNRRVEVKIIVEHQQLTAECQNIEQNIQIKKSKIQSLEDILSKLPQQSKVNYIGELNQELCKIKLQQSALTCPNCESRLYLNSGVLQHLPSVERSIDEIQQELQSLHLNEQQYNQRPSINQQLTHINQQLNADIQRLSMVQGKLKTLNLPDNPILPTKYTNYTSAQLSSEEQRLQAILNIPYNIQQIETYMAMYQQLNQRNLLLKQQERAMNDLNQLKITDEQPVDTHTNIDQLVSQIQKQKQCESQRAEYQNKITALQSQIKYIGDYLTEADESNIQEKQKQIIELNKEYQDELQNIQVQQTLSKLQTVYDRYMTLLYQEEAYTQRIIRLNKIKSVLSLAEYSILDSVLNRINKKINKYLSQMFTEPISVQLRAIREEKATERLKAEINLQITFGGSQFKSLTSLSGGQRSRVYLAFCLAFARLSQTPYILLDECTASLDVDIKEMVLQTLTDAYIEHPKSEKRRLIYITHHDTTEGVYTSVVKIKPTP